MKKGGKWGDLKGVGDVVDGRIWMSESIIKADPLNKSSRSLAQLVICYLTSQLNSI